MKKLALLFIVIFVLSLSTSAFSYEIQIIGNIPLSDSLTGISINSNTGVAAAVSTDIKALYIIDTNSNTVIKKIPFDMIPSGVAVDARKNLAVVSSKDGTLQFVDLETGSLVKTISVGRTIHSIAVDKENKTLFIGNSNSLMVMDLETGNIIKEASMPNAILAMDIDPFLGYLLLIMEGKEGIYLYDANTLEPVTEIKIGDNSSGISVNPSTHVAVATNKSDNSISIISLENQTSYLLNLSTSYLLQPSAVAVDPTRNIALITHKDGIAIVKLENPLPKIDSIIPESSKAGEPGFTLSIKGSKFIRDSKAKFNLRELDTLFEDNYNLKATIPSEELLSAGDVPVSVLNPPPGGGMSNSLMFKILNPVPQIESIKPSAVALTEPPETIRVAGKNFLNGSTVNLNGKNLKTRFISTILLEADLNLADIKTPAKYPVTVINPVPVSFTSNVVFLNVVENGLLLSAAQSDEDSSKEETLKQTGSLTGRILNTDKEPIEGVTIKTKHAVTQTDADGNFRLDNLPEGRNFLLLDGSTAKDTTSYYPTIPTYVYIMAGIVNTLSYQPYMHKQKARNFKEINPAEDTILTDPEVPGFEMRIPKGVNITGWDGTRNLKVSVRTVPPDRLSMKPLPPNAHIRTLYMFYFGKIGGGIPDQPIPIKAPNDLGLLPGEKAVLWYFDESPVDGEAPNDWAMAGTGTVTPDGKYIITDPGFGIPKFCCGVSGFGGPTGPSSGPSGPPGPGCGGSGGPQPDCDKEPRGYAGEPVDLTTGFFIHVKTDLHIPGIIPVNITRYYRSGEPGIGIFSRGTYFEYDWLVRESQDMFSVIKPGNSQYSFAKQPDGTYINTKDPSMRGVVLTKNTDNSKILRMRDGLSYKFDGNGYLVQISDRNGNALIINRTSEGYMKEIITPENRKVTFNNTVIAKTYRRIDSIVDSDGRIVKYTYEPDPFSSLTRLKTVTYPDGSTIGYEYDTSGRMSGFRNDRGYLEVSNEYYPDNPNDPDQKNRIQKQTLADGGIYNFNYTVAGGHITETSMTAPNSSVTTWRLYDDSGAYRDGYITKKITPDGTTIYGREAVTNLVTSVTDPLGRKPTYTYYATTDATNGLVKTMTDNLGNVTSYEYETKYGLPTKITDALLKATTFAYTFDANNRVTKTDIKDPLLNLTIINYNTNGMPTSITDPNTNTTALTYDPTKPGELLSILDALGNATRFSYDSLGRIESVTDAKNAVTAYTYDPMDRITSVTDPIDGMTRYFYDGNGNLVMLADAKGNMIWYEYDDRDRLMEMTDQLGGVESYSYYRDAEILTHGDTLKSITDRKGQTITFNTYDAMNRIKHITYHDGSYTDYTYDIVGRVDYINDSVSGYIDYTYNDFGCSNCSGRGMDRISKEVTPFGTINYTYDKVGRRTKMTVAGQPVVNYVYDAAGRMTSITTKINNKSRTYTLSYDNASRRTSQKVPLSTNNKYVTTTYGYDIANRLLTMLQQGPSAQIENLLYEYDPNGNRTKFTRNATQPSRDAVTGAAYNDANEMLTFTPVGSSAKNMTYDNNGNLLTVTNNCGTTSYTWDIRNRLVGISGYKSDCSTLTASFQYDAIGRRIQKTINGTTTQYVYDGLDIIQEKQGGSVTANYIRTLNIDETLTRIKGSVVRHYVKDALGSVIALVDDTGVVKTTYTYDPFGNVMVSGEASDNPFQYTGRENDGIGLYYYRARYYSPELQRFISEDPIGLAGGINLFVYVGNNPVNLIDPLGLDSLRYHVNALFPYLEWLNDNGFPIGYYPAYSGTSSGKYKPLPYGPYTGKHLQRRNTKGMRCENRQNGWSLDIEPNFSTNRTDLRIHPDEPPFGTKGCIGVNCINAQELYNQLLNYFNSGHSDIPVEVTY